MSRNTKTSIISSCCGLDAHSASRRLPRLVDDSGTENKRSAAVCCQLGVTCSLPFSVRLHSMESLSSRQKNIISSAFPLLRASSATRELPTCQKRRRRRPKQKVGTPVLILADSAAPEHVSVSRFFAFYLVCYSFFLFFFFCLPGNCYSF